MKVRTCILNRCSETETSHLAIFCLLLAVLQIALTPRSAYTDGMIEEVKTPKHVVLPPKPKVAPVAIEEPRAQLAHAGDPDCEWKFRLSPGATVWFFDEEDTLLGPAMFLDVWRTDYPFNYRVGIEGRHMYLGQESAEFAQEFTDKTTHITYLRIPFSVEYMTDVASDLTWYIGGGPDIVHTADDIGDTNVGMHLGTRMHYAFNRSWGLAVEAGYAWGDVDGEGEDVELNHAYITPSLTYTF